MTAELLARVSPGLAMQLGQPGDNPGMWFKLLLQARLSDLGEEYGMPMRTFALKIRFARNPRPPNRPPLSPAAQLAAEVKLELQQRRLHLLESRQSQRRPSVACTRCTYSAPRSRRTTRGAGSSPAQRTIRFQSACDIGFYACHSR